MIRTFAMGVLALVLSFFVATTVIHAQTTTTTPTLTPTPTTTSTPGAPSTGFGQ